MNRPSDRKALALPARERADRLPRVTNIDADLGKPFEHDSVRPCNVEARKPTPALGDLPSHQKISCDAHQLHHRQVLIDRRNTPVERIPRRVQYGWLAFDQIFTSSRTIDAGHDLDQRRLTGAIIPQKAVDLSGID